MIMYLSQTDLHGHKLDSKNILHLEKYKLDLKTILFVERHGDWMLL